MTMPTPVYEHDHLLSLDTNRLPIFKDALAPYFPGVDVQPLFLDPSVGTWVLRVIFHPGVTLPCHYHTGAVHLYTMSGRWNYLEYPDQPQTAGCYLFEPGGSVHTFSTPADNTELTDTFMVVHGANINFDQDGNYVGLMDASDIMQLIDRLVRERGMQPARYIRPAQARYTTA
ncbi:MULTISPECIES: 2,4'-dihydroxyacetophenone dioxygenase family protein [unclassified Pseudomonas]|uniref:2,4'-dihydroxyacetophenone dioxygenase family protein n=1 Tax=unclassified Pseudomonas TaxID=196821 RepID=UPI000C6EECAD|nr:MULTISPECIES: 2,4'-dihydroxyacetophenone dioxygenase family protein [unclassified Pseudomonas]QYX48850.1 2,4'-dihydroxyacetophenone dioxygenase family protein [Pseudomonas sp. S11A 273]